VIATDPTDPSQHVCKRVTATEGQRIPPEYRQRNHCNPHNRSCFVPSGHVWLSGDNPSVSRDSRTYGPVPRGLIRAQVWL